MCANSCARISIFCSAKGTRHDPRCRCAGCRAALLTACNNSREQTYQGWIEANLIFVSPDESGRIETLSVREGQQVAVQAPLFTLDDDLQQAEVAEREASLKNAQAAYDRAVALLRTNAGTQKSYRGSRSRHAHRQARLNSSQTQARAPQGVQSGRRQRAAGLFPRRRDRAGEPAGGRIAAARQHEGALLRQRSDAAAAGARRHHQCPVRRLSERLDGEDQLHRPHRRIHAAGDLQPGGAQQARLHDRGAAGPAGEAARRPAGHRHAGRHGRPRRDGGARHRHRRPRPVEVLRQPQGRARPLDAGQARHDLRLPRAERLRQDHDHPHADRACSRRTKARAPASATTSAPRPTRSSATSAT